MTHLNLVNPERTQLDWTYKPAWFFEDTYSKAIDSCEFRFEKGLATVTIRPPVNPVDEVFETRITDQVKGFFNARQLQNHLRYELGPLGVSQVGPDGILLPFFPNLSATFEMGVSIYADMVITDASGKIVSDPKIERKAMMDLLGQKSAFCPLLRTVMESYSRAVNDPANEFVHLYEIRDAIEEAYGGKRKGKKLARIALKINSTKWENEWSRFGQITNDAEIEQSRHWGKKTLDRPLRPATIDELTEVRAIAMGWIIALAQTL